MLNIYIYKKLALSLSIYKLYKSMNICIPNKRLDMDFLNVVICIFFFFFLLFILFLTFSSKNHVWFVGFLNMKLQTAAVDDSLFFRRCNNIQVTTGWCNCSSRLPSPPPLRTCHSYWGWSNTSDGVQTDDQAPKTLLHSCLIKWASWPGADKSPPPILFFFFFNISSSYKSSFSPSFLHLLDLHLLIYNLMFCLFLSFLALLSFL